MFDDWSFSSEFDEPETIVCDTIIPAVMVPAPVAAATGPSSNPTIAKIGHRERNKALIISTMNQSQKAD